MKRNNKVIEIPKQNARRFMKQNNKVFKIPNAHVKLLTQLGAYHNFVETIRLQKMQFLERYNNYIDSRHPDTTVLDDLVEVDLSTAIAMIEWVSTPNGYEYWQTIYHRVYEMETLKSLDRFGQLK